MTIINPKSITGVTSITTPSGSDNLFTVHTNNTTERIRINNDGDVIVGSGITVSPDGDIFATGVTTATTFVGALTGNVTGTIQTAAQPNITSVGTLTGLTVGGDISVTGDIKNGTSLIDITQNDRIELDIAGTEIVDINGNGVDVFGGVDISGTLKLTDAIPHTGDTNTQIRFPADDTITTETGGSERVRIDSSGRLLLGHTAVGSKSAAAPLQIQTADSGGFALNIRNRTSNNDYGFITFTDDDADEDLVQIGIQRTAANTADIFFYTNGGASSSTERLRIGSGGNLKFNSGFGSVTTVYGCRAWIQLNQGGSQSITGSGGVSSINDEGTGTTKITFTTAMPDDNWAMVGGAQQSSDSSVNYGFSLCMQSYTTTYGILIYRPSASSDVKEDNSKIHVAFFR